MSASRDALKSLSRKYPLPEQTASVIDDLEGKEDREVVIVTGALVEACLERSIINRLTLSDPNLIGQLFKNRGPLSDFHNKILIAQALRLASGPLVLDLKLIKDVRNAFAHSILEIRFETEAVKELLVSSETAELVFNGMKDVIKELNVELSEEAASKILRHFGARQRYMSLVKLSCSMLGFET